MQESQGKPPQEGPLSQAQSAKEKGSKPEQLALIQKPDKTEKNTSPEDAARTAELVQNEKGYLDVNKAKKKGLEMRYVDKACGYNHVQNQLNEFKNGRKVDGDLGEGGKLLFSDNLKHRHVEDQVKLQVDKLFNNPEKNRIATEYIKSSIALFAKAQEEGDISKDLSLNDVYQYLIDEATNVAYQDIAASENTLGDHGIRHLWGHNVKMAEECLDQLALHGTPIKAIDKLMVRRIMTDHDMGYAMDPVRGPVASEAIDGQDGGHNLLAAGFTREREDDPNNPINRVLSKDHQRLIHSGILNHDSSTIDFTVGSELTPEQTAKNIESAIHLADNTHAFETKLPEILYGHPETLKVMKLVDIAQDIGAPELIEKLKADLVVSIDNRTDLHQDDKRALKNAAKLIKGNSTFNAPRICGRDPKTTINAKGVATITCKESAIHRDVIGLFHQEANGQMRKFIKDLTQIKPGDQSPVKDNVLDIVSQNGKVRIHLDVGEHAADGEAETDYEKKVRELIQDPEFQEFISNPDHGEFVLALKQKGLQKMMEESDTQNDEARARLEETILMRKQNLINYMSKNVHST